MVFCLKTLNLAAACVDSNISFIGPDADTLSLFGDKVRAKQLVSEQGIPTIPGMNLYGIADAEAFVLEHGFPVMIAAWLEEVAENACAVYRAEELEDSLDRCASEAGKAFGSSDLFIEKLIENARHIEVQILGDKFGNIVHLFERDCSVQSGTKRSSQNRACTESQ